MSSENFFCTKFFHEISTGVDSYNRTVVLENNWLSWLKLALSIIQISPFILSWYAVERNCYAVSILWVAISNLGQNNHFENRRHSSPSSLFFFFDGATARGGPWPPLQTPPSLSIPCSVPPFVYSHLSQVRGHVIQPSHFWSSSSSCCIQLSVQHLFSELRCLVFFLNDQAIAFFGIL